MIDVEILFVVGCPNFAPLAGMVNDILREKRLRADVREREIRDEAQARLARFPGSPTLRINGRDVESDWGQIDGYSISCRTYGGAGMPRRESVEAALLAAARLPQPP